MDRRRENLFSKYEQILNIIFGAAFGALGSISLPQNDLSRSWFVIVAYVAAIAIPCIWVLSRFAPIAKCVAEHKSVRLIIYVVAFGGLAVACVFINILSAVCGDWGISARGPELSAILAAWAVTYLATGFWIRLREWLP